MNKLNLTCALAFAIGLVSLSACCHSGASCATGKTNQVQDTTSLTLGGKLFTSAWIQRSAEYRALCLQAYNIATLRLENILKEHKGGRPLAIVTDIDETILDNSPNSVHQALKGEDYTDESWNEWCQRAEADTLPGAVEFFNLAAKAGVEIFYVSNRYEENRAGTLENLRKFGFPMADDAHLLLRTAETGDKTARRSLVLEKYDIALLLGDNLGDFDHLFDSSDEAVRRDAVTSFAQDFGKRFIVLPNPNYGTWEKAMNGGYPALPTKDSILRTSLKTY